MGYKILYVHIERLIQHEAKNDSMVACTMVWGNIIGSNLSDPRFS